MEQPHFLVIHTGLQSVYRYSQKMQVADTRGIVRRITFNEIEMPFRSIPAVEVGRGNYSQG